VRHPTTFSPPPTLLPLFRSSLGLEAPSLALSLYSVEISRAEGPYRVPPLSAIFFLFLHRLEFRVPRLVSFPPPGRDKGLDAFVFNAFRQRILLFAVFTSVSPATFLPMARRNTHLLSRYRRLPLLFLPFVLFGFFFL